MSEAAAAQHTWLWQGHRIHWTRSGAASAGPLVVLIHGFGASVEHWRHNQNALAQQAEVFALDLLGFGASDKPRSYLADEAAEPGAVRYCFDLWAQQVVDFLAEVAQAEGRPVHLIGNSIGGMVALDAAVLLSEASRPPAQVILIDCAQRTLDEKRVAQLPPLERASRPAVKALVRQRWLIAPLFRFLARPAFIRQVLRQAYPSGANVDEELVALLYRPSTDPDATESFRGFVNLFEDHLAPDLLAKLQVPVRMIWGAEDPWEAPAEARRWRDTYSCIKALEVLPGVGHCPHDELPEAVNPLLLNWISAAG
ncbi:MAG: alpha/beta fold hydrolase [Cyanobacteria bacterium]|nr:alpha/beta fold hydrolase [Cyanobacteriota bacterium]